MDMMTESKLGDLIKKGVTQKIVREFLDLEGEVYLVNKSLLSEVLDIPSYEYGSSTINVYYITIPYLKFMGIVMKSVKIKISIYKYEEVEK
jgi:hypothetical protein